MSHRNTYQRERTAAVLGRLLDLLDESEHARASLARTSDEVTRERMDREAHAATARELERVRAQRDQAKDDLARVVARSMGGRA